MRRGRLLVVVCALLALPSALLGQRRGQHAADAGSKDAAKVMVHPIRGGMAQQRAAIGRQQQRVMNVAQQLENRSGNASYEWIKAQALQIQNNLHFGLRQLDQADAIATPAEKRHLAQIRSNEQAALGLANQLVAGAEKQKPDRSEMSTVAHRVFMQIQESGKVTAKDDWSS